ncbi:hypothetical protein [uncultured Draconibacterium sp.]|uniref:hypothetical protein n=1 Tax=uncultured Draconibacterium sp. TaxID=1573823 RepID=UPI002AA70AFB|nr:hypothetical protein [uncultured Draconibacterium sp.]
MKNNILFTFREGKKRSYILLFTVVLIISVFLGLTIKKNSKEEKNYIKLKASVRLDNDKIILTNKDTFDYINAKIWLNNYYKVNAFNLIPGETYTFWTVQFFHPHGRNMGANEKAFSFSMTCDLNNDGKGFYQSKLK